ncbi:MAG TPA: zf-HC2 domain-containing protein [bacterium]|nr:zf-HC2 domain-containing protein [bacterium]
MNCKNCENLFDDYVLGTLGSEQRRELEDHVASCKNCGRKLDEARALHDVLKAAPASLTDEEWERIEKKTLTRLRDEMAEPARQGVLSRLAEFLRPLLKPQPRLVFALSSVIIVGFVLVFSLLWFTSSEQRLISDNSDLYRLWTDQTQDQWTSGEIASVMAGVEKILAEKNGESIDASNPESVLDAITSESNLDEAGSEAIDSEIREHSDMWGINGYYSDILDASPAEMQSAIREVLGNIGNGS